MSTAFGRDDAPTGADPEMMMRHHRIQLQRPTGDALAAVLARVAVEPKSPKQSRSECAGGLWVLTPHKAMAWFDFPTDVTRFRFERHPAPAAESLPYRFAGQVAHMCRYGRAQGITSVLQAVAHLTTVLVPVR